jgi:hypothetical protein
MSDFESVMRTKTDMEADRDRSSRAPRSIKAFLESEDTLSRTRLLRCRQIAMLIAFAAVLLESFRTARP